MDDQALERIQIGEVAPDFTLPSGDGTMLSLSQFRGKTVILYFYPKDNTSGCTQQACDFRDAMPTFQSKDVVILGVSKDSIKSHQSFSSKYALPFILLSDEEAVVQQLYGVWQLKSMYGKSYYGTERSTFVIDAQGIITQIHRKVKVKGHIDTLMQSII